MRTKSILMVVATLVYESSLKIKFVLLMKINFVMREDITYWTIEFSGTGEKILAGSVEKNSKFF